MASFFRAIVLLASMNRVLVVVRARETIGVEASSGFFIEQIKRPIRAIPYFSFFDNSCPPTLSLSLAGPLAG